jgi:hypothetical protein
LSKNQIIILNNDSDINTLMKKKSYQGIIDRVERIRQKGHSVMTIGTVTYGKEYPLFLIQALTPGPGHVENIFLSGGVHADEEAGIHTVLEFFEEFQKHTQQHPNRRFYGIPCINPSGFEDGTLETRGRNLNRLFGVKIKPETEIVTDTLGWLNQQFLFSIDFHETDPSWQGDGMDKPEQFPTETWIYETQRDKSRRIGPKMIAELPPDTPVCQWPEIYGDTNINGVISYPEGCGNPKYAEPTSLDAYLQVYYTNHSFTTETPKGWPLEKRVATHLSYLQSALRHIKP